MLLILFICLRKTINHVCVFWHEKIINEDDTRNLLDESVEFQQALKLMSSPLIECVKAPTEI